MKKNNYSRYFRFIKYDTAINQISTNDFKPIKPHAAILSTKATTYSLDIQKPFYYGFLSRTRAMEMAKAGALEYMETLIDKGRAGLAVLMKYRSDHYQDLNENLTYENIEAIKNQNTQS